MKAIMASTGGRAPPGQNKQKPCAGSRLLAAVPGSPARAPSTGPAPRSSCRPEAPRRVRADAATSAGFPRCSRSWPRSSRSPSTAKRARPGARAPFARLAPSPQASSSSLSSWFPWLHPLRSGSLRETRGGSLAVRAVGIVGLSVGQSVAVTMAMERSCGELRLADFDRLELTNLNRLRAGVHELGLPKVILAARQIAEIDPFLPVRCFPEGITAHNLDRSLLEDGPLSLLVEECDSMDIKVLCRERARE